MFLTLSQNPRLPKSETLTVSDRQNMANEMEQQQANANPVNTETVADANGCTPASRKERRKAAKREKRRKKRQETADFARREEEARLNDPEELLRLQAEEEQERLRVEKERKEFEERERKIIEEWQRRQDQEHKEEEERRIRAQEEEEQLKQNQIGHENEVDDDDWEYVEDGPPEIIWQGNEIIVKKKKIRVKKKDAEQQVAEADPNRPTSNPLPPESEAFADYKNASMLSAQELLENVAQETPNFGTEQDKAHCPFHLKTGACRFGSRCSRIHFYPDKSCTLLIKNMYSGPGLAWEQDEGLEYTDEEIECAYEEFYEDVHTEFLKFGEIVNFKVCRNGSSHLRGNLYVHYKSLDSAVMAYHSVNARYYAGKQLQCEFVGVTRWKVAICGEFMKSKLQTCSRGTACNFIHCFRNPGGDYEWADWDKPPPNYWLKKMTALFGLSDEYGFGKTIERGSPRLFRKSSRISADDADRHHSSRSQSREIYDLRRSRKYSEDYTRCSARRSAYRKQLEVLDEDVSNSREKHHSKISPGTSVSDENLNLGRHRDTSYDSSRNHVRAHKNGKLESLSGRSDGMSRHSGGSDSDDSNHHGEGRRSRRSRRSKEKRYERSHGDPSGVEREIAHAHKEKSLSCYSSDELEDKKSTRQSANRRKCSRIRDDSGRGDGKIEHDNGSPSSNRDQSYRSHSSPRYYRKDSDKLESDEAKKQYNDHHKRSKRKRGTGEQFDSEIHEAKSSRPDDQRMEEVISKRGRWEHNDENSLLNSLTDQAADKKGRWEPD